jgi:hypothetical protein
MNDDLTFRKSSYSGGQNNDCVEIAFDGTRGVWLRDSKDPQGGMFNLPGGGWTGLTAAARDGVLELPRA